jgi:hypothetical protein
MAPARTFIATLLRKFAAYAAAPAGYTVAIIAADKLGATGGGPSPGSFLRPCVVVWTT